MFFFANKLSDKYKSDCHVQLNPTRWRDAHASLFNFQIIFWCRAIKFKLSTNFQFTYDINFHVQLVRLLLVLLVACTRLGGWWKIQVPVTRWRCLLQGALGQGNASMFSRWWLLGWMGSGFCLTTFVTGCRCLFTLLQVTASIGRLVACLIEWKKQKSFFVSRLVWKLWKSFYFVCLFVCF